MAKALVQDYPLSSFWRMKNGILRTVSSPAKIANFLKVGYSRARKLKRNAGLPLNVLIEPTRNCNYACTMCPRQTGGLARHKVEHHTMSFEEFKAIMDQIGDSLVTIRFWHFGEPLLAPDFFKMVKYAKKKRIFTATSSNMEMLSPEKAEQMVDSGLDYLLLNFNGATKETYEKYTGRKDVFEKVVGNIKCLVEAKKRKGSWHPFIDLQFIIMKGNDMEVEAVKRFGAELGVDKVALKKVMGLTEEKQRALQSENPAYQLDVKRLNRQCKFCSLPWEECVISSDGRVSPCAVDLKDDFLMGNVFEKPFIEIWNGQKYQRFRESVAKDIDKVKICTFCGKRNNPDFYVKA